MALHRGNSKTLGYLPTGAFEEHAKLRQIVVAVEGDEVLGYLLYRVARSRASVVHLCVAHNARGRGIARLLVEQLKANTKSLEGIGLYCCRDYDIWRKHNGGSGLNKDEFDRYFEGTTVGYAIRIGKVLALKSAIPLGTLRNRRAGFRPPQSYHYWNLDELLAMAGAAFASAFRGYLKSTGQGCN